MKPVLVRAKKWDEPWPASLSEGIEQTIDLSKEADDVDLPEPVAAGILGFFSGASIILAAPVSSLDTEPLVQADSATVAALVSDVSTIRSGMLAIEQLLSTDQSEASGATARMKHLALWRYRTKDRSTRCV
jgi:hypothetical protein